MVVRLRLARHGTRNNPFYHIVAIRDKAAREARPIEKLGEYDPVPRAPSSANGPVQTWQANARPTLSPQEQKRQLERPVLTSGIQDASTQKLEKRIEWNVDRIRYWLNVGAQPSKPVARLLDRAGLIPEGKWFKGMYKPESEQSLSQRGARSPPTSEILSKIEQSTKSQVDDKAKAMQAASASSSLQSAADSASGAQAPNGTS